MSAYRKLTETLRDQVLREAYRPWGAWGPSEETHSWLRALVLLEDELAAMGDDE